MDSRFRRWWPVLLLFPIPFSPWWLTGICLTLFCFLVWLLSRPRRDHKRAN